MVLGDAEGSAHRDGVWDGVYVGFAYYPTSSSGVVSRCFQILLVNLPQVGMTHEAQNLGTVNCWLIGVASWGQPTRAGFFCPTMNSRQPSDAGAFVGYAYYLRKRDAVVCCFHLLPETWLTEVVDRLKIREHRGRGIGCDVCRLRLLP